MNRKKDKIKPDTIARRFWLTISGIGFVCVVHGSTYTNYLSYTNKGFPWPVNVEMAIAITLAIIVILFMDAVTIFYKIVMVLVLIISMSLGFNAMSGKEITGIDDRLRTDVLYLTLKTEADSLNVNLNRMDNRLADYQLLQLAGKANWTEGSRNTRIARDTLAAQLGRKRLEVDYRRQQLLKSGTVASESFVKLIHAIRPNMSEKAIQYIADCMYSIINELLIPLFTIPLTIFFPWLQIPVSKLKRKKQEQRQLDDEVNRALRIEKNNDNIAVQKNENSFASLIKKYYHNPSKKSVKIIGENHRRNIGEVSVNISEKSENIGDYNRRRSGRYKRKREVIFWASYFKKKFPGMSQDDLAILIGEKTRGKPYSQNHISGVLKQIC